MSGFLKGIIAGLLGLASISAWAADKGLTFQGYLKSPLGDRVSASGVAVASKVVSPNGCILLSETHAGVNIVDGFFTVVLGKGTRAGGDRSLTMKDVFSNATSRTGHDPLTGAAVTCDFVPSSADARWVVLEFQIGGDTIAADFNIRANAFAVWAESSEDAGRLGGKAPADFIQTSTNVTQARLEEFIASLTAVSGGAVRWNGANFVSYNPADGSLFSTNAIPGSAVASLPFSKVTSVPAPLVQIGGLSCANGKILKMAAGAWSCADETGGVGSETDPTVQAFAKAAPGAGLAVSGGALVADFGTGAGKVVEGDDSRLADNRVASDINGVVSSGVIQRTGAGSFMALGTAAPVSISGGAIGLAVGTGLTLSSGSLVPDFGSASGKVAQGNDSRFPSSTCASGSYSRWTGSAWACDTDAATDSSKVAKTGDTMSGTLTLAPNGLVAGSNQLVLSGGNVGVGTASPGYRLSVVNTTAASGIHVSGSGSDNGLYLRGGGAGSGNLSSGAANDGTNWVAKGTNASSVNMGNAGAAVITFTVDSGLTTGNSFTPTERMRIGQDGNVGIGTTAPVAKLEVQGQIVSKSFDNGASTTFDFANGNVQFTSASCGALTLSNMVDGGNYTIVINGTTSGTCTFSHAGLTFLTNFGGATTASTKSIFSFQRVGTQVFVSWSSGYQ